VKNFIGTLTTEFLLPNFSGVKDTAEMTKWPLAYFLKLPSMQGGKNHKFVEQQTHSVRLNCWGLSQPLEHEFFTGGLPGCCSVQLICHTM
jgi:hypothetical protein